MAETCGFCDESMLIGEAPLESFFTFATDNGSRVVHTSCVVNVMTETLKAKRDLEQQQNGRPSLGQRPFFCPWCSWSTKVEAYRVAHVMEQHVGTIAVVLLLLYETSPELLMEASRAASDRGRLS